MPLTRIVCPRCGKRLKTDDTIVPGRRARCTRCGHHFDVMLGHPAAALPQVPRRRAWLWAGIVLAALLLMMGVTLALLFYDIRAEENPKKESQSAAADPQGNNDADAELLGPQAPDKPAPRPEKPWLAAEKQTEVNRAIERGVRFLRDGQVSAGFWAKPNDPLGREHPVGVAALPALTLLECDLAADDPQIQKAVKLVRDSIPRLDWTYDLALAILLLDRLNEAQDRPHIRSMTLRLVAGQHSNGGWSYQCPILNSREELALLAALEKTRPSSALDLFQQAGQSMELGLFVRAPQAGGDGSGETKSKLERLDLAGAGRSDTNENRRPAEMPEQERNELLKSLPKRLRAIPSLHSSAAFTARGGGDTDNSNTQFAILGLLAAERYNVHLEQTLALIAKRFEATQRPEGFWIYGPRRPAIVQPSMMGAGLLGMAVKYGLVLNSSRHAGRDIIVHDEAIDTGLRVLSEYIGQPMLWGRPDARDGQDRLNLYALWSIERVGVLYHLRKIHDKEWYPWGVDLLLKSQQQDGAWRVGEYWQATDFIDTCFALLFLRRADFAPHLSKKLEFFTQGKELE